MRPLSPARPVYVGAAIAALITGCTSARDITEPIRRVPIEASRDASTSAATVVHVADVERLYAAVNDPANAGTTILLAPGTYVLSTKDASGVVRPNGGRIELQQDMSISGVANDRAAVVIDAASLPASSFSFPLPQPLPGRTGVIRIGRGRNAVEWLTVAGNPLAAAAIETDLASTRAPEPRVIDHDDDSDSDTDRGSDEKLDAWVRVAHVVAGNSARGVDVRNLGAAMAGRRLHAEIVDNEFFRGIQGIRVANFLGAHGGQITVVMSGNRAYMNVLGCIVENNRSDFATIHVRSNGDRFYDNGYGCIVGGGLASAGVVVSNSAILEAHGSAFINNTRTQFFNNTGQNFGTHFAGILAIGGEVLSSTATASHNTVVVRLWGSRVTGNQRADFEAWGARSSDRSRVAGVDNHAIIELHGVSKKIDVVGGNSSPADPSGTNTLTVNR